MNGVSALWRVLDAALDAILPLRERAARTKARSAADVPLCPTVHDLLRARITTLMDYREEATQDLVRSLKYDGSPHAAALAAAILADYLQDELADVRRFSQRRVLLVPVPLHKSRTRERGFNQIELVLRALPREYRDGTRAALAPEALARTRATNAQTRLHRSERLSNVAGAFACPAPARVAGARVYLLDDVTTTGATLVNAAQPLKRAGADVTLLALARA